MATKMNEFGLAEEERKSSLSKWKWILAVILIFLAIGACSYATQSIARAYGYHASLGGKLWNNIYAPWMCLVWNSRFDDSSGVVSRIMARALCIFFVPLAGIVGYQLMFARKPKGSKNIHGSARWATLEQIKSMSLLDGEGVYVGGFFDKANKSILYLRHNGPEHILAFMPTRSGKGVGLILPTLLAWPDSTLVFDIKGENWALTAGYLHSLGHHVLKFDPADTTGACAPYNPVDQVRLDTAYAIPDAQNLVRIIMDPDGKSFDGPNAHWKTNGASLLAGVLLHCMIKVRINENRTANLRDLAYMFGEVDELFDEMKESPHAELLDGFFKDAEHQEGHKEIGQFIVSAAETITSKPPNERGSVISTAITDLALYKDPIVAKNTAYSSWKVDDLLNQKKPVNLYLAVSPGDQERMKPLLRIIITQIIYNQTKSMEFKDGRSTTSNAHRLLYMLDELPALGKIQILANAISYIAGYGGKMYLIVQDVSQLADVYGKDNALMGNCHIRIGAAPNKPEAAEFLSKLTGKTTVVETKTSLSGARSGHLKNASVSVQEVARPLLTPDECMRLPSARKDSSGNITMPGDMLVFVAGNPPIYGKQILYFKDPEFSKRAKIPAPPTSCILHNLTRQENVESSKKGEKLYEKHFNAA
ncbi:MAG: type IV secretory system conjugative DNA transfer family protein [Desulfovibrio sp.]|jgi:type IV secretion system protein VirD4|nr:type IV secretory system conjugative DNA transfer family protein [Desulfovibrio sp.]